MRSASFSPFVDHPAELRVGAGLRLAVWSALLVLPWTVIGLAAWALA